VRLSNRNVRTGSKSREETRLRKRRPKCAHSLTQKPHQGPWKPARRVGGSSARVTIANRCNRALQEAKFMRPIEPQENSARMSYDCQLPEDVRAELLKPRRARKLGQPPASTQQVEHPSRGAESVLQPQRARLLGDKPPEPPRPRSWFDYARCWWHPAFGWLLASVSIVALAGLASRSAKHQPSLPVPTVHEAPPVVQPAPPAASSEVPAPRAQLVPVPVRRATLVRLPEWKIDTSRLLLMPYGEKVEGTLRGFLSSETQLPRIGHVGDTWLVGTTPWIWLTVPGTAAPTWIDP
jgi:hypothetical protein